MFELNEVAIVTKIKKSTFVKRISKAKISRSWGQHGVYTKISPRLYKLSVHHSLLEALFDYCGQFMEIEDTLYQTAVEIIKKVKEFQMDLIWNIDWSTWYRKQTREYV